MASPRDHILADMAALFASDGAEIERLVIDGVPVSAIENLDEEMPEQFPGEEKHRLRYLFLPGLVSFAVGQEKNIDGVVWRVTSASRKSVLLDVEFTRFGT